MTTAAAYMRCSGLSQTSGDTWERQIDAITACCKTQGLTLIHEYREEAVPGKLGEESRPAFQLMVAELLGNGCRTIVVESLDRLARQYDIQQQLATYLASKELTLISANTGEDITAALMGDPMRRALVQIQGIFAELDKNLLVAKLRKARERKRARGERVEGKKPYGFYQDEGPIHQSILRLASCGVKSDDIAKNLNDIKTFTRSGKPWSGQTIRKILKNEATRATKL